MQGHDHPLLYQTTLTANDLSFGLGVNPKAGTYTAKTRYRSTDAQCELEYIEDNVIKLTFAEPQWAITSGQSVVIYDNEICLGGGIII